MDTHLIEWFISALGATIAVVIGAVVILLRVAFKLGAVSHEVTTAVGRLEKIEKAIDLVPIHETKIKILETEVTNLRRKVFGMPSNPNVDVEVNG